MKSGGNRAPEAIGHSQNAPSDRFSTSISNFPVLNELVQTFPRGGGIRGRGSQLAVGVEPGGPVLRLFGTDPEGDLHDQRGREPERRDPTGSEVARSLHKPAVGAQTDLSSPSGDQR